jgi:hypothetical protein
MLWPHSHSPRQIYIIPLTSVTDKALMRPKRRCAHNRPDMARQAMCPLLASSAIGRHACMHAAAAAAVCSSTAQHKAVQGTADLGRLIAHIYSCCWLELRQTGHEGGPADWLGSAARTQICFMHACGSSRSWLLQAHMRVAWVVAVCMAGDDGWRGHGTLPEPCTCCGAKPCMHVACMPMKQASMPRTARITHARTHHRRIGLD